MKTLKATISITLLSICGYSFADSAKLLNPANGHVYKRFDNTITWTQAKNSCANQKGYLVTITSQAENDLIVNILNKDRGYSGDIWLGASDAKKEGTWVWITGETWNYTSWAGVEPNDGIGGQDYLSFASSFYQEFPDGTWDDRGLPAEKNSRQPYICEWDKPIKNYTGMIISDTNNDSVSEFVLIGNNDFFNKVVSIDRQNKAVISEVDFSAYPTYVGVSLSVVADMNNNGKSELSLLLTKKADSSSIVETRDSGTGELLESYIVPR